MPYLFETYCCKLLCLIFSVIICTYNRQKFIGACLQCLALQTLPAHKWEVLVINNRSSDNSEAIILQFIQQHPHLPFRYLYEGNPGVSYARNRGLAECEGQIAVYIDDDVEVNTDYLATIEEFFLTHPDAVSMGGRTLPKFTEGPPPPWLSWFTSGITGTVDKGLKQRKFRGRMKYPVGCNMAYTREILVQAGGFNNQLTARADEKYIYEKVKQLSNEIWYVPQAFSWHNMDADRMTHAAFKKLYIKGGAEEKIKTRSEGKVSMIKKATELIIKLGAGLFLWLSFTIVGKSLQGRYVYLAQWYVLKGFFS